MKPTLIDAILALVPNAQVVVRGMGEDAQIEWIDPSEAPVTRQDIDEKLAEMELQVPFNQCKNQAKSLIAATDWAVLPDVGLKNSAEYVTYRGILRGLIISPVANPDFPAAPTPIWE